MSIIDVNTFHCYTDPMNRTCRHCQQMFAITAEDQAFYDKIQVPAPTFCPQCRQQRRLTWRNERMLYSRQCDLCHKSMLSVFAADKLYTVYCNECWHSDQWNPYNYGRDFDFLQPFFSQFETLFKTVPQLARSVANNQNSEYVNQCGWSKNCYLI